MAFKQMTQSRDVGLSHGPGKGSAPRNNSSFAFRSNYGEISWKDDAPLDPTIHSDVKRKGGKLIKRYK